MQSQKLENLLNQALNATESERERSQELNVGYNPVDQVWELIIRRQSDRFPRGSQSC